MDCVDCRDQRYCDIQGCYLALVFFSLGGKTRPVCSAHNPEHFHGVEGVTA